MHGTHLPLLGSFQAVVARDGAFAGRACTNRKPLSVICHCLRTQFTRLTTPTVQTPETSEDDIDTHAKRGTDTEGGARNRHKICVHGFKHSLSS